MQRALVACTVVVVALAVTPSAGNERFLRGVHQGCAGARGGEVDELLDLIREISRAHLVDS